MGYGYHAREIRRTR